MTPARRKRTLREQAWHYWNGYLWGLDPEKPNESNRRNVIQAWIAGYRAGRRERKP